MTAPPSGFDYEHALLFVVGLGFFILSNKFSALTVAYPAAGWMTALCAFVGLGLLVAAVLRVGLAPRHHAYVFGLGVACIALSSYLVTAAGPPWPSDEVGLSAVAAEALTHGENPYTFDYRTADPQVARQPSAWFTPTFSGSRVAAYAYPAGTVLVLAPVEALVGPDTLTELYPFLLLLSVILVWFLVPRRTRPFVTVMLFLLTATGSISGSIDPVYLPFLVLAVWRWPRFVMPDSSALARYVGPMALGVACSMKQNAWLLAPFLLLGIIMEARARGVSWPLAALKYTATAVAVFLAINLPFMVLDLHAWTTAIGLPFTLHTALFGNGVAAIPLATGGDQLQVLGLATYAALAATLALTAVFYTRARLVLPLLPVVAVMFSTRSLNGYVFFLLLPAIVSSTTIAALPAGRSLSPVWSRRLRAAGTAAAVAAVALTGYTLAQRPPLQLAVTSSVVDGSQWRSVSVVVLNSSGRAITPSFFAAPSDVQTFSLARASGPATLAAGASATYELQPLSGDNGLHAGDVVHIVALSDQPESLSQSDLYRIGGSTAGT